MRELNAKQTCMFPFIVFDNVHIVTVITCDISCVILLYHSFDTMSIPKSVHKIMVNTYRITINVYLKMS